MTELLIIRRRFHEGSERSVRNPRREGRPMKREEWGVGSRSREGPQEVTMPLSCR